VMSAINQQKKASKSSKAAFQIFVLVKICANFKRPLIKSFHTNLKLSL